MNTRKPLSCISTKRLARKRLAIALSLVFSGLGTLALSQTAAAADDYQTIDGVGVTAQALKIDVSLQDTPQSVNIVTREHLDNTVATKIDDSLRYTPGFWNSFGPDFDTNWITIRGFDSSVLVDGKRQYKDGYFATIVEPFALESIEVVQGPSSALYGNSQPGGVINMVTKKPTKTPLHQVSVSGGSNDYVQGGIDISDKINEDGSHRYRVVAMGSRSDGVLDGVDGWRAYIAPSYTIDISPNTSLTLTASYLKDRRVNNSAFFSTYGTLIPVNGKYVSRHTNYGDPEHDKQDTSQFTLGWDFSHKFNDAWTYKNSFTFMHQDFYMRNTAAYNAWEGSVLLTDKLQRYSILNDGKTISFSFDNNLTGQFETGDFANIVQLGFDYNQSKNDFVGTPSSGQSVGGLIDIFNPTYGGLPDDSGLTLFNNNLSQKQLGIYAQAQTTWNETIVAKIGGRYDRMKIENDTEYTNAVSPHQSLDKGNFSWNAGLMYLSPIGVSPYVNYSESFYAAASLANTSDWKLILSDPIESKQWEAGVKFTPEWLDGYINLAYFDLKQKNALSQTMVGGTLATAVTPEKETRGVEIEAHATLTKSLSTDLTYTYMSATYGDQNTRADYMPHNIATAWVNYDFTSLGVTGLTLGTGVRYRGTSINTATKDKVDDVLLWDAAASWKIDNHWKLNGTISNITDKVFISGAYGNNAYYGEGRLMKATVTYSW